jgi:hypothetical protein
MLKICHLRGQKDYWLKKPKIKNQILTEWEKLKNFNFLEYRKKMRNIVISSIKKSKDYNIICYNDQELQTLLTKIKDNEKIIYHSQDDDDIYVGKNTTNKLQDGFNHTPYVIFNEHLVHQLYKKNTYIPTVSRFEATIPQLYTKKRNKPGSCNLIIQSTYKYVKPLITSMSIKSFYSRKRIRQFIKTTQLQQNNIKDIINIELKSFFSLTYLKQKQKIYNNTDNLNEFMTELFEREYNYIKSINIKDVEEWEHFKEVYKEFKNKVIL